MTISGRGVFPSRFSQVLTNLLFFLKMLAQILHSWLPVAEVGFEAGTIGNLKYLYSSVVANIFQALADIGISWRPM